MHINGIKINGFAAIKEFELEPMGGHVKVSGGNRRGKSTFMRAVFSVLSGKDLPDVPVNGESLKAAVVLELSDGHTITWTQGKTGNAKLKVERDDGQPITGGDRTYLTRLIGDIGRDPMELVYMAPKDQKAHVQKILGLDFSDLDAGKVKQLDLKKNATSQAAVYRSQLDQLGNVSKVDPVEALPVVDIAALLSIQAGRNALADRGRALAEKEKAADAAVNAAVDAIEGLKLQIESLEAQLHSQETLLTERQGILNLAKAETDAARAEFKKIEDPAPAIAAASETNQKAMADAAETNRKAEVWKRAVQIQASLEAAELAKETAIQEIESLDAERVKRLTDAKFPVKGLEFTEDGITYNGLPFNERSQCTSDIIKVGLALQMVADPGLKVVRINRGSELDKESQEKVFAILTEYGFQGFIEEVTDGDLQAVTLETITTEEGEV